MSLAFAKSVRALSISCLIFEALQHLPKALYSNMTQEILNVWTREPFERIVAKRHVFNHNSCIGIICGFCCLSGGDEFR